MGVGASKSARITEPDRIVPSEFRQQTTVTTPRIIYCCMFTKRCWIARSFLECHRTVVEHSLYLELLLRNWTTAKVSVDSFGGAVGGSSLAAVQ